MRSLDLDLPGLEMMECKFAVSTLPLHDEASSNLDRLRLSDKSLRSSTSSWSSHPASKSEGIGFIVESLLLQARRLEAVR